MAMIDVVAEMTGTVKEVLIGPGDSVNLGQELLFVESMKMEIPVESPASGTVAEVLVAVAESVEEGQVLARVEQN
jgi:acetyl-CoA carboxylase biotin carboxyl carrier protein